MPHSRLSLVLLVASAGLSMLAGCTGAPKPPPRFQIDPEKAAQEAMTLYDKNHDGKLDAKELEATPPLAEALKNLKHRDSGHGDDLTAADIQKRFEEWNKSTANLQPGMAMVYLDGKMLEGATVTFEPEPFLGPSYRKHQGTTNATGMCDLDNPDVPDFPHMIYVGLYRVRISKVVNGKETIPPQYNEKTTLGREVATDVRDSRENIMFRLKSK